MRHHFRAVLISSVLFFSLGIYGASAGELRRPIALDKIDGGDLYALDASGIIFRLSETGSGLGIVGSFELPAFSYPTDLISAKLFGQPALFVTLNSRTSNLVSQWALDGKRQHDWSFTRAVGGLDVDFNSHILYITASGRHPEIYRIILQPPQYTHPEFIGEAVGAGRLGPIVFDPSRNKLFVGDIETGRIFEFDIRTHRSRVVSTRFSSPQALLVSADGNLLYVADGSRRRVYKLDLARPNATPRVFAAIPRFKSPSGLARLDDGRIVVSDYDAGKLFVFSRTGTLESTFP
jgi:hypothetical protein